MPFSINYDRLKCKFSRVLFSFVREKAFSPSISVIKFVFVIFMPLSFILFCFINLIPHRANIYEKFLSFSSSRTKGMPQCRRFFCCFFSTSFILIHRRLIGWSLCFGASSTKKSRQIMATNDAKS